MEKNLHENVVQRELKPMNGMLILILVSLGLLASIALVIGGGICLDNYMGVIGAILLIAGVLGIIAFPILYAGLRVVGPNEALVLTLFGNYYGTILKQGFYFVNPFSVYNNPAYQNAVAEAKQAAAEAAAGGKKQNGGTVKVNAKKTVSLKNITLNNGVQKVNDVMGNPIVIGAVVIWRVVDPTKAVFNVEDYTEFLSIQTDSTIRNIARMYPYDIMDTDGDGIQDEKSLRGSAQEIAETMKNELNKKVEFAGLMIEEVRITHLAYSEEIAAAMLKRQQAEAVIAARAKILEGGDNVIGWFYNMYVKQNC